MEQSGRRGAVGALGGPLAARVIAETATLLEITAQASRDAWDEAGGAAVQAASLRGRALELGGVDVEAHAAAADLLRRRAELDPERRDEEIAEALAEAAVPPLELTQLAADVGVLAAEVAERCDPDLRADAVAACLLAEAGGRAAAHLLEINLAVTDDDERLAAAHASLRAVRAAAERALGGD